MGSPARLSGMPRSGLPNPVAVEAVVAAARRNGVLTRVVRGAAVQVSPAFGITEDEIEMLTAGLQAPLREVAAGTA